MRKINKKGVLGLESVRSVILFLLILAVTAIAVFLALNALSSSNLFSTSTAVGGNMSIAQTNIINNITQGTTGFFANVPTIFTILGAVVILLIIGLIIYAVYRFTGGVGGGAGSQL